MPANRQDLVVQRVVVRNGFTCELAGMLVRDIRRHLDWFAAQPGFGSAPEAGQFPHQVGRTPGPRPTPRRSGFLERTPA
jgi:glutamate decarboxylase